MHNAECTMQNEDGAVSREQRTENRERKSTNNNFVSWCLCAMFFLCGNLYAQSTATEIEALLEVNAVTYAQAARFILDAAEQLTTSDQQEAFAFAQEQGWLPKKADAETQARLDGISYLLMNAFGIKGGLFYTMTKLPHYAYRELVYRNIIQGRAAPGMKVSGEYLLFIINRALIGNDIEIGEIE